jgi:3-dehydroquinate synthase
MGRHANNIVLTGFSGTGKSLVAEEVAHRLNWSFIDTDREIVRLAGKPIADIFQQDGESRFRELEREVIEGACRQKQAVISVGGGAIVDPGNYELLAQNGLIICLEAKLETIYQRLFQDAPYGSEPEVRPLLSDNNPLERIRQLKASRQPYYANVDWTVHTDRLSISQVAEEVIRAWGLLRRYARRNDTKKSAHNNVDEDIACRVETATQSYPIFVGYGLLDRIGEKMRGAGLSGKTIVISDESVFSIYGKKVERILRDAGFAVNSFVVPPGEATKNVDSAARIYDFLVAHRAERDDVIVALGGGMVGDLAGFVAATFLRGMPWVQVPTSLVAMVDASIGGKVGVNHPQGKNLIGAFYQPGFVLADVQALTSLPRRELASGWAEVIKYGFIVDKDFFKFLEADADKLTGLEPNAVTQAIARSAAIKAEIVSEDEREKGKRTILNYGHTIAHGLETATQYGRFLHGEAVAIGMMGAAKLSERLGLLSSDVVKQQQSLLERFDLPISFSGVDLAEVLRAIELDKKTRGKKIRWVLLEDIGRVLIRSDVPEEDVMGVLQELSEPGI